MSVRNVQQIYELFSTYIKLVFNVFVIALLLFFVSLFIFFTKRERVFILIYLMFFIQKIFYCQSQMQILFNNYSTFFCQLSFRYYCIYLSPDLYWTELSENNLNIYKPPPSLGGPGAERTVSEDEAVAEDEVFPENFKTLKNHPSL